MANVDVNLTSCDYGESDFDNCVCVDAVTPTLAIAAPIPAPLEDVDKIDIYFDVSAAIGPDYSITAAGDWLPVSGDEAYRQSMLRRFITNPGEWATKPEYGAGGRAFLKAKATKSNRDAFAGRLRAQALMDPRTDKVGDVTIERFTDGGTKFSVQLFRKSKIKRANPVTVTFEGR